VQTQGHQRNWKNITYNNIAAGRLLFASSGHCCAALKGSYSVLKVGADTVVASSHVRLLDVDISLDLSVDRRVSRVCAGCFYRLRQLRRIRRSLD